MKAKAILVAALPFLGCGGDDGGPPGYDEIANQYANPTGEIGSAADAQGVAAAFAEVSSRGSVGGSQGERRNGQNFSYACGDSGSCSGTGSGNQSSYSVSWDCTDCCYTNECCYTATGWAVGSTEQGATYTQCAQWDGSGSCGGDSWSGSWSYCYGSDGYWWLVDYQGETYTVKGSYNSSTGGSWTVNSANGTWTCTANGNNGSCTDGTTTYDW